MDSLTVKILVCPTCKDEAEKTNHLDLYSTYRSIIFGCQHSIEDLKREVDEQVAFAVGGKSRRPKVSPKIVKHSKIEFKDGKFHLKGDRLPLEKKIPEDLGKM